MEKLVVDYMDPRARARRKRARLTRWAGNLLRRMTARLADAAPAWCLDFIRACCRRIGGAPAPASYLDFVREWRRRIAGPPACVWHVGRPAVDVRRGIPMCGACIHELEGEPATAGACFEDGP